MWPHAVCILQAVAGIRSLEYAAGLSSGVTLLLRPYTAAPLRLVPPDGSSLLMRTFSFIGLASVSAAVLSEWKSVLHVKT